MFYFIYFIYMLTTKEIEKQISELKQQLEIAKTEEKVIANANNLCQSSIINNELIGQYCIVRTYSAGVFAGILLLKDSNEVIIQDARRLWYWYANQSISLSGIAKYGLKQGDSKIAPPVDKVWVEAIEIIPIYDEKIIATIKNAPIIEQNS